MGYRASLILWIQKLGTASVSANFTERGGCKNPQIWLYPMLCSRTTFAPVK